MCGISFVLEMKRKEEKEKSGSQSEIWEKQSNSLLLCGSINKSKQTVGFPHIPHFNYWHNITPIDYKQRSFQLKLLKIIFNPNLNNPNVEPIVSTIPSHPEHGHETP